MPFLRNSRRGGLPRFYKHIVPTGQNTRQSQSSYMLRKAHENRGVFLNLHLWGAPYFFLPDLSLISIMPLPALSTYNRPTTCPLLLVITTCAPFN